MRFALLFFVTAFLVFTETDIPPLGVATAEAGKLKFKPKTVKKKRKAANDNSNKKAKPKQKKGKKVSLRPGSSKPGHLKSQPTKAQTSKKTSDAKLKPKNKQKVDLRPKSSVSGKNKQNFKIGKNGLKPAANSNRAPPKKLGTGKPKKQQQIQEKLAKLKRLQNQNKQQQRDQKRKKETKKEHQKVIKHLVVLSSLKNKATNDNTQITAKNTDTLKGKKKFGSGSGGKKPPSRRAANDNKKPSGKGQKDKKASLRPGGKKQPDGKKKQVTLKNLDKLKQLQTQKKEKLTDKGKEKKKSSDKDKKKLTNKYNKAAKDVAPAKRASNQTALGHEPHYRNLSDKLYARRFDIPPKAWRKMTPKQQWKANKKFLDRMISKGDKVLLATPAHLAKRGSYFAQEISYLRSKGYRVSKNGLTMLPPGQ